MKLVKVTWLDTNETSDSGWLSLDEVKKTSNVKFLALDGLLMKMKNLLLLPQMLMQQK